MMRLIALFGLLAGGIIAAGRLTAAQWQAAGQTLLTLTLAYGLTVLPWMLVVLLAWAWRRERRRAWLYERMVVAEMEERQRLGAQLWESERARERRPQQRKRVTR